MTKHKLLNIFLAMAIATCVASSLARAQADPLQAAKIEISYLPANPVASSRDGEDVSVEVELIFRETMGFSVRLDQLKRTFTISGGVTIEDPLSFISLNLSAGMESHVDVALVIPASVSMICLGGGFSCDLTVRNEYTGIDSQGNTISSSVDIPIHVTIAPSRETFTVGEISITSPKPGQKAVPQKLIASADIAVTGVGSVSGQWILNGKPAGGFSRDVISEGKFSVQQELPEGLSGANRIQLVVNQPEVKESDTVEFTVEGKEPAGDVTAFDAGVFSFSKVSSSEGAFPGVRTGRGVAAFKPLGIEVEASFENLSIVNVDGVARLDGGRVITDVKKILERGPLKVSIDAILITADGAWADGSVTLAPSGLSDGIGPLYFYALPFNAGGLSGGTKLETSQKGEKGEFRATVDEFELIFNKSDASLKVSGDIQKPSEPGWKMPLSISVSLGGVEK